MVIEFGAKINGQHYREVLLMLPVICSIAGYVFVFQQDSAPTHGDHDMVKLLYVETPHSLTMIYAQPTLLAQIQFRGAGNKLKVRPNSGAGKNFWAPLFCPPV